MYKEVKFEAPYKKPAYISFYSSASSFASWYWEWNQICDWLQYKPLLNLPASPGCN